MKHLCKTICTVVALDCCLAGCGAARTLGPGEYLSRHKSVEWIRGTWPELGLEHYLYLPGAVVPVLFPREIAGVSVSQDVVSITYTTRTFSCSSVRFDRAADTVDIRLDNSDVRHETTPSGRTDATGDWRSGDSTVWRNGCDIFISIASSTGRRDLRLARLCPSICPVTASGTTVRYNVQESDSWIIAWARGEYVLCVNRGKLPNCGSQDSGVSSFEAVLP